MLIRRLKERCAAPDLVCVGTSATMVASREATPLQRRETVADFASQVFGRAMTQEQAIEETLEPFTQGGTPTRAELSASLTAPSAHDPAGLPLPPARPLVRRRVWRRTRGRRPAPPPHPPNPHGCVHPPRGGHRRGPGLCREQLRELLTRGGDLTRDDGGRAFAFKLHQFIGQGRAVFSTIEPAATRQFSLEGQAFAGPGRLFVPIKFCRHCGQDYYHVIGTGGGSRFLSHPLGTDTIQDGDQAGYLMLAPLSNDWSEDRIPDEWRDQRGRLKPTWRDRVPQAVWVTPNGDSFTMPRPEAIKLWWQPTPFSLCQNCGEFYTARELEFAKLASLSSEARTSATTVLAVSLLRRAAASGATTLNSQPSTLNHRAPATSCSPSPIIARTLRSRPAISTISFTSRCSAPPFTPPSCATTNSPLNASPMPWSAPAASPRER